MLERDWDWGNIIKPPKIHTLPDILSPFEIEQLIAKTRKLRYRVFLLTTYSLGLRPEETFFPGDIAETDSLTTMNALMNTLPVDFRRV